MGRGTMWTDCERERVRAMWREGKAIGEIAADLGRSYASVYGEMTELRKKGWYIGKRNFRGRIRRRSLVEMTYHPVIRFIFEEMNRQLASYDDVAKRAGVSPRTISEWGHGKKEPLMGNVEAVLGALGYRINVVQEDITGRPKREAA